MAGAHLSALPTSRDACAHARMTPHVRLHIQLEPQLGADLQKAAHELGVSTSELVRRGARKVVDDHQLGRGAVMPAASAPGAKAGAAMLPADAATQES